MKKYRIVKLANGKYALQYMQSIFWFKYWSYFIYAMGDGVATWDSLKAVEERLQEQLKNDAIEEGSFIKEVVKEV